MKNKKILNPLLPGRYGRMSAHELDREVEKFDREFIADAAKPLTRAERARERRARLKRGRPIVGKGAKRVLVTIERGLLERSDAFARRHGLSRAAVISRGLETLLKAG